MAANLPTCRGLRCERGSSSLARVCAQCLLQDVLFDDQVTDWCWVAFELWDEIVLAPGLMRTIVGDRDDFVGGTVYIWCDPVDRVPAPRGRGVFVPHLAACDGRRGVLGSGACR